ncbi:response regulator [Clostridium chromiireducens]|uniref:Stage 0 sporulation protein A homolog n=1 Tax=Clostridium chromiireducens TaxID=225345 RepID=A0A1V4J172_9CLOT|nr:response regulator [Clostridium chromiireducens]OPJ65840.1 putative transcriptional regulatory protein pdtaR [Clostridium chromiireducens]
MDKNKLMSKILIVDDNNANILLLEKMLKISGYSNIKTLTDSRQVLDLYSVYEPDLILLDFRMPFMDGLEIIDSLNLSNSYKNTPIIMLSAENEKEYHEKALDKGALDFITKPFNYNDIISKIKSIL